MVIRGTYGTRTAAATIQIMQLPRSVLLDEGVEPNRGAKRDHPRTTACIL
jgi:hypothetical protein